MLKKLCLCILLASLMTACTFNQRVEDGGGLETTAPVSNPESQNNLQQSSQDQAPLESHDEEEQSGYSSDAMEEINPNTNQSSAVDSSENDIYDERALDAEIEYLSSALSESHHGGIHRISDYNGSGRAYHGGDDKANPYILVWVVDKNAVDAAINRFTGQKVEVVYGNAGYSLEQLNAIKTELENSEISGNINSAIISEDNKVLLDIIGQENLDAVNKYLSSYHSANAVSIFAR